MTFPAWRERARALLAAGVRPEDATWDAGGLFSAAAGGQPAAADSPFCLPARAIDLLERVACHRDPGRHALMYRLVWRMTHGERMLLQDAADDDVVTLTRMARAVDRASHKMTAFVRFRELRDGADTRYIAVFAPEHDVLARTAPFFARRFGTMVWTIFTPDGGAHWDRRRLSFFPVVESVAVPAEDAAEALWLTYYESIFNPARLNLPMMRKEMPVAYWKHLPEATRIPALVAEAPARAGRMVATTLAREVAPYAGMTCAGQVRDAPVTAGMPPAKTALDACRRCALGALATQAVAGAGPIPVDLMLVGEQPGDEEDLQGKPFVGPAGRLLRRALQEAGIAAERVYITNAVKHFSFEPRGKRRIHKTPGQREIEACRDWLDAEIAATKPSVIVALGASALYGIMRKRLAVGTARTLSLAAPGGAQVIATYHPSAVLRGADEPAKAALYAALVEDLRRAAASTADRG